jgi:SAM-dependent methyltransferase
MQNMLLRATELGLSACPMAGFRGDGVIREVLNIPDHLELLLLIAVGYPDPLEPQGPVSKVSLADMYRYNGYKDLTSLNGSPNLRDHTMADLIEYRTRIAPVYAYRYRLHTFKLQYYDDAMRVFAALDSAKEARIVLDLVSYDGIFLRMLTKEFGAKKTVMGADHIAYNREFFSQDLKVKVVPIRQDNIIECEPSSVDVMSFVFHAEFTPDLQGLMRSAATALKPGGEIFVAIIKDYWYRRLAKSLVAAVDRYIRRMVVNIYEGNPFYRVGPRGYVGERELTVLMRTAGFEKTQKGIAARYPAQGTALSYYVFRK